MVFKFAYFVVFTKGYQPAKFQFCRLSGSSFTEGSQKHNDDVMMTSFHTLGFTISIFCKIGYKLSTCKVSNPSVIWIKLYRGFIRHPQNTIMTSLWRHFKLFGFQNCTFGRNLMEAFSLANFIGLGCLDQNLRKGGGNTPLRLTRSQKAQSL